MSTTQRHWISDKHLAAALKRLLTDHGVMASDWTLFRGAVFGRDSLMVALDLLDWYPELVERIILSLAQLQGVKYDRLTEEEPGKIHHEHRTLYHDGIKLDPAAAKLLGHIAAERHIGSADGFTYYGTVDATLQYVRLLAAYVHRYGPTLFDRTFTRYDGTPSTIRDSLLAAAAWTSSKVESSPLGLVEFQRTNPHGLKWHVLRDGTVSYLHTDGNMASTTAPVASLEVQGLAYDALLDAAELLPHHHRADAWRAQAERLRLYTLLLFWMPHEHYFAMAIDRDEDGLPRQLQTVTAVPGELLDTRFFDQLPPPYHRARLVEAIVRRLYRDDLMTPVGPRMRSLNHLDLLPYADYQGPYTSWPVITNIIARGLIRQGMTELARDLEARYLAGIDRVGACAEFFYVDEHGRIAVHSDERQRGRHELLGLNLPELNQAWTVSAAIRAGHHQPSHAPAPDQQAGRRFTAKLLEDLDPAAARHTVQLNDLYINQVTARRCESEYLTSQGYGYEVVKAPWLQTA